MAEDDWSWLKWIKGHVSIKRYGKDIGTLIRLAIIVAVGFILFWGFITVKSMLFPKKPLMASEHVDRSKIESNQGTINQTDSHSTESVTHNHMPFENGLLGAIFGSKDQVVKEDKHE